MKVTVKNYGSALLLDADEENKTALVQLLKEGPAQNLRVPLSDVTRPGSKVIEQSRDPHTDNGKKEEEKAPVA